MNTNNKPLMIALNETLFIKGIITEEEKNKALIEIEKMFNNKQNKTSRSA